MNYLVIFSNSLIDIFGEGIRKSVNGLEFGINLSADFQKYNETLGKMVHIFKITDETKASKYIRDNVSIKTELEANQIIDDYFADEYTIYNEGLMSANLTQMISRGQIDLDEMRVDWTQAQETEWLYRKGVSGIRRKMPKYLNDEYVSSRLEITVKSPKKLYTKADFLSLFTVDEWVGFKGFRDTVKEVDYILDIFEALQENYIDLADSRFYDTCILAAFLGAITEEKRDALLNGVTRIEKAI